MLAEMEITSEEEEESEDVVYSFEEISKRVKVDMPTDFGFKASVDHQFSNTISSIFFYLFMCDINFVLFGPLN